jgi:phenylacetate-CoA ligase
MSVIWRPDAHPWKAKSRGTSVTMPNVNFFQLQCWLKYFYRQGSQFKTQLGQLAASAEYSPEALERSQNSRLGNIIKHCYEHIPYYQDLFKSLRLKPADIRTKADLEKLPLLDKETVNASFERFISKRHKSLLCHLGSTSGSTGAPAKFWRDYESINFENAALWRHWRAAGDYGKKRVTIRGEIIVPVSQTNPPFWKYNPASRELLMSGYHLSFGNSRRYIDKILEFEPNILYCYPSTAHLLAKFFDSHDVSYHFDAIFTSSEVLDGDLRRFIEKTFRSRIYDWYGQAERVAAISECPQGCYHILEDYALVETLPTEHGLELVGTHFSNKVMPLIRYRTHDYVELTEIPCRCSSYFRTVKRIVGRNYGYIVTPEGARISITNHIPRGVSNLVETQFYQERPGEVVIKVVTNGRFRSEDKARLIQNTLEHTSPTMKVIVQEVDSIPRGANGKFVAIISMPEAAVQVAREEAKEV